MFTTYDQWRTASRDDYEGVPIEEIAAWYGVEPDEVTDTMVSDYLHDRVWHEATRWDD